MTAGLVRYILPLRKDVPDPILNSRTSKERTSGDCVQEDTIILSYSSRIGP